MHLMFTCTPLYIMWVQKHVMIKYVQKYCVKQSQLIAIKNEPTQQLYIYAENVSKRKWEWDTCVPLLKCLYYSLVLLLLV